MTAALVPPAVPDAGLGSSRRHKSTWPTLRVSHFTEGRLRLAPGELQCPDSLLGPSPETTTKYFLTVAFKYWVPGRGLQNSHRAHVRPSVLNCWGLLVCPC